jgi:Fe-S-cluster containining protein
MNQELICKNCSLCCKEWTIPLVESDIEKIRVALNSRDLNGFIWVGPLLEIEVERYNDENTWCRNLNGKVVYQLKKKNDNCIFWDEQNKCRIYDSRPSCCRIFPYWENNGELIFDISALQVKCAIEARNLELKGNEQIDMLNRIEQFKKELEQVVSILNQTEN